MRYRILGPLEIHDGSGLVTPTAPKTASVMSMLLVHANQLVLAEAMMNELWNGNPPVSANTTLQTYVYQIRCALGRDVVETRPRGYCLPAGEDELDLLLFRSLVARGRKALDLQRPEEALHHLRAGLALWRGLPFSNIRVGPVLEFCIPLLEEERRRAAELAVEAAFAAGRHREVIADLRQLIVGDPYNEWLHARLIEALTLVGRRRDALAAYESLRRMLAEHLGLDPTREVRELERQVLEL